MPSFVPGLGGEVGSLPSEPSHPPQALPGHTTHLVGGARPTDAAGRPCCTSHETASLMKAGQCSEDEKDARGSDECSSGYSAGVCRRESRAFPGMMTDNYAPWAWFSGMCLSLGLCSCLSSSKMPSISHNLENPLDFTSCLSMAFSCVVIATPPSSTHYTSLCSIFPPTKSRVTQVICMKTTFPTEDLLGFLMTAHV